MIIVKPIITDIKEFQRGNLPQNAAKIDTARSMDEMMKKAAPIAAVLCIVLFITMLTKTITSHKMVFHPLAIVGGFVIGFGLLAVHEWLHAIVYPKEAKVTIGKVKGNLIFVALASHPMTRARFIFMSLLPFVLGVLPLAVFIFSPADNRVLNGLMFGMAGMGMVSPCPDVYNVLAVLKQSKKTDKIMFYEDDLFRISEYEKVLWEREKVSPPKDFVFERCQSVSVNAYLTSAACNLLKLYLTVCKSKECVVRTAAYIYTGMNVCASLSDDDVAGDNGLAVSLLHAETLGLTVTAVLCRTNTFFMCKEL